MSGAIDHTLDIDWDKYTYSVIFFTEDTCVCVQMWALEYMHVLQIQMHTSKKYGETHCKHK
jgi:hypothetical protein